ncbi:hypothetical protein SAMN04487936_11710 [Halobacillus dabanensis]|uniref:Uncharacterized protein n=2 Tax=Halobacillus dabanensis TaxID=240302 RepID=A0A1I4AEE2_HALDA|nr:hypothetical protein SAMN04487936_11710 [Halobacillus dabanensis]
MREYFNAFKRIKKIYLLNRKIWYYILGFIDISRLLLLGKGDYSIMLTSLYILSLTVLLTFLVLYSVDKVVRRVKKVENTTVSQEPLPTEMDFSHQSFK